MTTRYGFDAGNMLTPYAVANPNAAVSTAVGAISDRAHLKEQQAEFGRTSDRADRALAGAEYRDQRDYDQGQANINSKMAGDFATEYGMANGPEGKAAVVSKWAPQFAARGYNLADPGAAEGLLAADAHVRSQGQPGETTTPDAGPATSVATGEPAPSRKPMPGEDALTYMSTPRSGLGDVAAEKIKADVAPAVPAAKPEPSPNDRTQPAGPDYQTHLDPDVQGAIRRRPVKPVASAQAIEATKMAEGRKIANTPDPQTDESVQPPDEIAAAMKGPMTPTEFEGRGRPMPVNEDWKKAPVNPGTGPTLMGKDGKVIASFGQGGQQFEANRREMLQDAQAFTKNIENLDPRIMPWAKELEAGVASGNIRDRKMLETRMQDILAMVRTQVNAHIPHGGGGGRTPVLDYESGRKAAEDEQAKLRIPEYEKTEAEAAKAEEMLKSGSINAVNAVRYSLAKMNDPRGIVTTPDYENTSAATLWEKVRDFWLKNGEMPTLSPEEIGRMGDVMRLIRESAHQNLLEARAQLKAKELDGPSGEYRRGYQHSLGTHAGGTKSFTGGLPAPNKQFPNRPPQ